MNLKLTLRLCRYIVMDGKLLLCSISLDFELYFNKQGNLMELLDHRLPVELSVAGQSEWLIVKT